jgi:thioredoxin-related protein
MKKLTLWPAMSIAIVTFMFATGFTLHNEIDSSVSWISMEQAQEKSAEDGKPLFVFVEAEWCGICKRMLANVFPNQDVSDDLMANYHPVKIDLDSKNQIRFNGETMTEREFAREMIVAGTPTTIFFDSAGDELGRQVGFVSIEDLQQLLAYVVSDQFNEVSFEEFQSEGR